MAEIDRVLIVGGGIGGLTLATALQQRGISAELIERSPSWRATGAGLAVQANGLRILRDLGLGATLERSGCVIRRWQFRDQAGDLLCESDLESLWGDAAPFVGVTRQKLQEVLLSGASAVPCRLGTVLTSLSRRSEGALVSFSDGSRAAYGLVVGADGVSSEVRQHVLGGGPASYGGHLLWRSIVPIRPRGLDALVFHLGDRCFFGLLPVGDGATYGFGSVTTPRHHDPVEGRLQRLRQRFAGFGDLVQEYLAAVESDAQILVSTIEWVDQELWHAGRVVLVGDAAHASSPLMGQGGCMAMEDAYVLAEELSRAATIESALDAYVRRRVARVKWVQEKSRAVAESFLAPPEARNAALREHGDANLRARFRPLVAPA